MPTFLPEPASSSQPERTGILLINLGTPDAPRPAEVRRYLAEFLSDQRVVELPAILWWPILHGVILRIRPAKSAKKYASIWDAREGSPLLFHTRKQASLLEGWLKAKLTSPYVVEFGMRYGNPSVASAIAKLSAAGCQRILCVPMYPQYAASSSASALDAVWQHLLQRRNQPEIRTIRSFHAEPGYIDALADNVRQYWMQNGRPQVLVISFHGIPERSVKLGDPYQQHCETTGKLLAQILGLDSQRFRITYQSRFGSARWIGPATDDTLTELARAGCGRVDVVCPGFVADCLETLEEIAMEGRETFLTAGGKEYHYIPALNENSAWIAALGETVLNHLQGWISA